MQKDTVTILLEQVAKGEVSIKDARAALEGVDLDEETYVKAIDHGVFNPADPGTVVNASLAPSGASLLVVLLFVWGIFWTLYWMGAMLYGLFNNWEQQDLAFHLAMTFTTLIIMGIVYMKWVLPDKVVVKYARSKYIPEHPKDWVEYKL